MIKKKNKRNSNERKIIFNFLRRSAIIIIKNNTDTLHYCTNQPNGIAKLKNLLSKHLMIWTYHSDECVCANAIKKQKYFSEWICGYTIYNFIFFIFYCLCFLSFARFKSVNVKCKCSICIEHLSSIQSFRRPYFRWTHLQIKWTQIV